MPKGGDLPKDEAKRVLDAMRTLLKDHYGGNKAALARAIGRSAASVGDVLAPQPKHGPSLETATLVADLLNVEVRDLLDGTANVHAPLEDLYPERLRALRRLRGLLPSAVEAVVRSIKVLDKARPMSEIDWIELSVLRLREYERAQELHERVSG